jgi:hypothetical protein
MKEKEENRQKSRTLALRRLKNQLFFSKIRSRHVGKGIGCANKMYISMSRVFTGFQKGFRRHFKCVFLRTPKS